MANSNEHKHWSEISSGESYKLSMAEFKGATIQALKDLDKRVASIENYNNNSRLISMFVAGISGIVSGVLGTTLRK